MERGIVLYEIDPRPYQAEVARAKANLLQANAKVKRLDLDFRRAQQAGGKQGDDATRLTT